MQSLWIQPHTTLDRGKHFLLQANVEFALPWKCSGRPVSEENVCGEGKNWVDIFDKLQLLKFAYLLENSRHLRFHRIVRKKVK